MKAWACSWIGARSGSVTGSRGTYRAGPRRAPESALYQSRYLLNDGRLFFDSPDHLVPQASNHKEDVYRVRADRPRQLRKPRRRLRVIALVGGGSTAESAYLEATRAAKTSSS